VWKQGSIFSLDHFDHLTALLEMAFHGFGGGSARLNEFRDPTMFHCLYTNGTIYYTFSSLKGFNSTSQRTRKAIEAQATPHYLPILLVVSISGPSQSMYVHQQQQ
jgi:hypothetical protein